MKVMTLFAFVQDIHLGYYPGVDDSWMDIISSQGSSLLSVDISGSNVSNSGLLFLKDCLNIQNLTLDYCGRITDNGLLYISGIIFFSYLNFYFYPSECFGSLPTFKLTLQT